MMESRKSCSLPAGVPEPFCRFAGDLAERCEQLHRHGAQEGAASVRAVHEDFLKMLSGWLDETVSTTEAAAMFSCSPETVRRRLRDGRLPDRRRDHSGPHKIRRGDVITFDSHQDGSYDPDTDAQDIATRRRLE